MDFLVFSTTNYHYFQQDLCKDSRFQEASLDRMVFPDGEKYQRLRISVRGQNVVVVGGTVSEEETLELFDLACGLVQHGCRTLIMVVPYFGYATMERAVHPGEIVTGKNRALLLSAIPKAQSCNEILMIDLHTGGIPHYFEGQLRPYHLYAKRLICDIIRGFPDYRNWILASTDAGRAKWVEQLAGELGIYPAFVYKRRLSGEQTEVCGINADVKGKNVVIYDDMIRTGGSLINAARAYRNAGACQITAITTHGVFPASALEGLRKSGLFDRVIATDTHPRAHELGKRFDPSFYQVYSVIPHIREFLTTRDTLGDDPFLNA